MAQSVKRWIADYTLHNKVRLVRGGAAYFTVLKDLIDRAASSIHLQVYILDEDETGRPVIEALINAARRGVKVFVLVDGYASQELSQAYAAAFKTAGVHFRMFEPIFKSDSFYFGRRMHYKVVVADARICLVGGLNIADRYNDLPGKPAWLDFALLAEGEVAYHLLQVCLRMWFRSGRQAKKYLRTIPVPERIPDADCMVRVRVNDWVQRQNNVSKSYLELFGTAQEQIIVMSSYFLPGRLFRKALSKAVKRGVKVKIVLAGVSDIKLAKHAERYIYRWIFRNRMELYEYRGTVLHAKIATCDNRLVTAGSYNVNNISAYASIEMNLDVKNAVFANEVTQTLESVIQKDCIRFTEEDYELKFNVLQKMWQYIAYQMVRLIYYLFTFYFKQQKRVD